MLSIKVRILILKVSEYLELQPPPCEVRSACPIIVGLVGGVYVVVLGYAQRSYLRPTDQKVGEPILSSSRIEFQLRRLDPLKQYSHRSHGNLIEDQTLR